MGMKMFRQGDVLLIKVGRLPKEAKKQKVTGTLVLAYGEATGHKHAIYEPGAHLFAANEERYLVIEAPVSLRHEEHGPIKLDNGVYKIGDQWEYTPAEIKRVVD